MPPKASQGASLNAEQVQLLCQVVQYSDSPKKEGWDIIAENLNITNGNAAQQRFGRLLKTLKAADPTGISDGGTPKLKTSGKRAASSARNGTPLKKARGNIKEIDEDDEEEEEDKEEVDFDEEETPTKKRKSWGQNGAPKWKSIFQHSDVVKIENNGGGEDTATITKTEDELDGEIVT